MSGFVYLLKAIGENDVFYKIGRTSRSAKHRADELGKSQALDVTVLAEYQSSIYDLLETVVLRNFATNKKKGEWFSFPDGIDSASFLETCERCEKNLLLFDANYLRKMR